MPREPDNIPDETFRLLLARGLGPVTIAKLTDHFQSFRKVVSASADELTRIHGITASSAASIRHAITETDPSGERQAMNRVGARLIAYGDDDYPAMLAAIQSPPAALWIRGTLQKTDRMALAIVGSRRCTAYGREQAGRFSSLLAQCGLVIVSGGAVGIDAEAHRGALRVGGRTIAVMGCGLARCYPPQHADLFEQIVAAGGALVSALPMQSQPKARHFPSRNRIIAGLSLGVLVVEAARRSGALITARWAGQEQGREVMALPGRVDSPASAGCLAAIRDGWAALVGDPTDVLAQLDASSHLVRGALEAAGHPDARSATTLFAGNLTPAQKAVLAAIEDAQRPLQVDQIAAKTGLPVSAIMADLTLLQIRGRIQKDHEGVRVRR